MPSRGGWGLGSAGAPGCTWGRLVVLKIGAKRAAPPPCPTPACDAEWRAATQALAAEPAGSGAASGISAGANGAGAPLPCRAEGLGVQRRRRLAAIAEQAVREVDEERAARSSVSQCKPLASDATVHRASGRTGGSSTMQLPLASPRLRSRAASMPRWLQLAHAAAAVWEAAAVAALRLALTAATPLAVVALRCIVRNRRQARGAAGRRMCHAGHCTACRRTDLPCSCGADGALPTLSQSHTN